MTDDKKRRSRWDELHVVPSDWEPDPKKTYLENQRDREYALNILQLKVQHRYDNIMKRIREDVEKHKENENDNEE